MDKDTKRYFNNQDKKRIMKIIKNGRMGSWRYSFK